MARLQVGIGADVTRFVAGMNTMEAAARRTSASIKSSMNATLGVGGSTASATSSRQALAATERLTKARVAQEAAVRKIAAAEARLAEVRKGSVASETALRAATERQTRAREALQRVDRDASNEKLKIQQKEEAAVRRLGIAEAKAAQFRTSNAKATTAEMRAWAQQQGLQVAASGPLSGATKAAYKSATSTSAQLRAEDALATAQERHAKIQRDSSNEILKARQAEKSQLDRLTIAEKDYAAAKDKTSISGLRKARELKNAENALAQAARARSLVAAEQATILERSSRKVATAQKAANDAAGAAGGSPTARLTALSALTAAQEAHTQAVRDSANADSDAASKRGKADRAVIDAEKNLKTLQAGRASSASAILSAENSVASAREAHAKAIRDEARAQRDLDAAEGGDGGAGRRARLQAVGTGMLQAGAAAAIGVGLVAKAAVDWQKAWTEVTKTVDFGESKWGNANAAMAANEAQLRSLAKTIPITHEEIAATASMLGTLGVGADDLGAFTKVASQLGTVTSLSAEEAATSLTQLMTVSGEAPKEIGKIGSALVALSLDGASTERQILQTGLRIGSAGKSVGFATEDTLALGSALGSVGIQAEAGGNNMATTLTKIDRAVRGGGAGLEQYAKLTGMTADQFKQSWGEDAPEALAKVLDGLGGLASSGGNVTDTLRSMGIMNIREIRNMRDLALATKAGGAQYDLYRTQLQLAREEREKGTKLDKTAEQVYKTDAAKITLALNSINDAAIDAGASMLPVIADMAQGIANTADSFGALDTETQGFIIRSAGFAAAGLLVGGSLLKMGTGVASLIANLAAIGVPAGAAAASIAGLAAGVGVLVAGFIALNQVGDYVDSLNEIPNLAGAADLALSDLGRTGDNVKFDALFSSLQNVKTDLIVGTQSFDNFGEALDRVSQKGDSIGSRWKIINDFFSKGVEAVGGGKGVASLIEERITAADDALAKLVSEGDLETAAKGFDMLVRSTLATGGSMDELLPKMDSYKESLAETADQVYGVTLSNEDLVAWMGGKVPDAIAKSATGMLQGATASDKMRTSLMQVRGSLEEMQYGIKRTVAESATLAASLFVEGNLYQNTIGTHVAYAQSLDDASKVLKKNGEYTKNHKKELDDNTQAGRDNITVLNNIATSGKAYVESLTLQGKGSKAVKAATKDVRGEFLKAADAAGLNSKAANKLADDYGLVPKEVNTKISAFVEAAQQSRVDTFEAQLNSIEDKDIKAKILATFDKEGAEAAIELLEAEIKRLGEEDPVVTPQVDTSKSQPAIDNLITVGGQTYEPVFRPDPQTGAVDTAINGLIVVDGKEYQPVLKPTADTSQSDPVVSDLQTQDGKTYAPNIAPTVEPGSVAKTESTLKTAAGKKYEATFTIKTDKGGLKDIQTLVSGLKSKTIKVTIKANPAGAKDIKDAISGVKSKTITVRIKGDTKGASKVTDAISGVKSKTITVKIKGDPSGAKDVKDAISGVKAKTIKVTVTGDPSGATKTKNAIGDVKSKTVKVTVGSDTSGASRAKSAIASVQGKTVYIDVVERKKKAAGGPVYGPGTSTSDSIPALLSNGEFVIRAAAAKAIGMANLYAMNAQGYAKGGRVGYASGGPVGTPTIAAIDYKIILKLIAALTNPVGAINAARARVTAASPGAAADARALAAAKKLNDEKKKEEIADKKAADRTKGKTAADKEYARTKKEQAAAAAAYTKASDKAGKSAQKLKEAQEALNQANKELSDTVRQMSAELATPYRSASNDILDWLDAMQTGQADLAAFQKQVVALRKSGLSETLIQQIANKGAIAGQELAGQILAGGKAMVDSLNTANKGLQTAADEIGYTVGSGTGRYASGGPVVGPGTGTSDSVVIRASAGEYVVNAASTAMNRSLLDMINYSRTSGPQFMPAYAQGGYVNRPPANKTDYHAGDVNLYGVIGDPELWLRKAQQSKHDSQIMHGLTRQFV